MAMFQLISSHKFTIAPQESVHQHPTRPCRNVDRDSQPRYTSALRAIDDPVPPPAAAYAFDAVLPRRAIRAFLERSIQVQSQR